MKPQWLHTRLSFVSPSGTFSSNAASPSFFTCKVPKVEKFAEQGNTNEGVLQSACIRSLLVAILGLKAFIIIIITDLARKRLIRFGGQKNSKKC